MRLAHRLPPAGGPPFVAVLREQLAAVARERRAIVRQLAGLAGVRERRIEHVDVDLHPPARIQRQHVVAQRQDDRGLGAGRLERPAGDIQRLVEVVGRRLGRTLGPEQLGRPLAVHAPVGRQREQLHQALGLAQPPGALGHDLLADADGEGAEQLYPHSRVHAVLGS